MMYVTVLFSNDSNIECPYKLICKLKYYCYLFTSWSLILLASWIPRCLVNMAVTIMSPC